MSHKSVLLLILISFSVAVSEKCNSPDMQALLKLKKDLGNPSALSSWIPTRDCCNGEWQGVSCKFDTPRVDQLFLSGFDLPKPTSIPSSIGNFPFLVRLEFGFINNLVGEIPPAIAKLTNLHYLIIQNTNISGQIPHVLSQIKTLEAITLIKNKLSGTLPPSLSSLPNLIGISFDRNQITGPIPDSYGSFSKNFTVLSLLRNRLTGKIPASLAKLNLAIVDLTHNMLEGDASVFFGSHKSTQKINLANNLFSFDFGKVGLSPDLMRIDIANNRIFGTLPKGLTQLKHFKRFNVSSNNLCGEIPQGGRMDLFDASSYSNNKCLCGSPLPACSSSITFTS